MAELEINPGKGKDMNQHTTLIIADTRMETSYVSLKQELVNEGLDQYRTQVIVFEETGLAAAYTQTQPIIDSMQPKLIIIIAGIWDIIQCDALTNQTSLRFSNSDDAIANYMKNMEDIMDHARRRYPNTKVIFGLLTDLSLNRFNMVAELGDDGIENELRGEHPQQVELNNTILRVNEAVSSFNKANKVVTPCLASTGDKKLQSGKFSHQYHLLPDGYHLSPKMVRQLAREIVENIHSNSSPDKEELNAGWGTASAQHQSRD